MLRRTLQAGLCGVFLLSLPVASERTERATRLQCVPREQCCKVCAAGRACGNSCIRASYDCHKGRGCACNEEEVC
jgi:hypothetical protein